MRESVDMQKLYRVLQQENESLPSGLKKKKKTCINACMISISRWICALSCYFICGEDLQVQGSAGKSILCGWSLHPDPWVGVQSLTLHAPLATSGNPLCGIGIKCVFCSCTVVALKIKSNTKALRMRKKKRCTFIWFPFNGYFNKQKILLFLYA